MVWLAVYTGLYERRVNIRRIKPFSWRTIECISYCSARKYLRYLMTCVTDNDLAWVLFFLLRRKGMIFRRLSWQVVLCYIKFQMRSPSPISREKIKGELAMFENKGRVCSYGSYKLIQYVSARYTPTDIDLYTTLLQRNEPRYISYPHLIYCCMERFLCTIGCSRIFKFLLKTAQPWKSISTIYTHWGTPPIILNIIENILDTRTICSTPLDWLTDRDVVEIRSYRRYLM